MMIAVDKFAILTEWRYR